MIKKTDIIISGGGLAGLIATVAFGSSGYNVLCVEPITSFDEINSKEKDIRTTAYLQPSQAFLQKVDRHRPTVPRGRIRGREGSTCFGTQIRPSSRADPPPPPPPPLPLLRPPSRRFSAPPAPPALPTLPSSTGPSPQALALAPLLPPLLPPVALSKM